MAWPHVHHGVDVSGKPALARGLSLSPELRAYFAQLPPRTVLSAPLMLHDEVIGVLGIGDNAGREFSAEEIRLVQAFATQAATALRNARLYQEAQDAYHQLAHTQEQFVQAQKMEAVGRLAGGIAHDFNNLLTIILGRTQLQLLGLPGDHPMRPDLELIQNTAERAATLTRQLLQPQILDLNALIRDISQLLRRLIGEDITLVTVLDPTLGQLRADPSQLSQVLLNLAINARDAMPHGGQLTIETANVRQQEEDKREAPRIPPGQYVQLRCSDTGVGMDTTVQAISLNPFLLPRRWAKARALGWPRYMGL